MILYIYIYYMLWPWGVREIRADNCKMKREREMGNDKNFPVFVQFLHPTARPLLGGSWRCNSTTKRLCGHSFHDFIPAYRVYCHGFCQ